MIDSHCHLDFAAFDDDRQQVIEQARNKGVGRIVIPGVASATWQNLTALCAQESELDFALGLHPWFLEQYQPADLSLLEKLINTHKKDVKAVGEIGLDYGGTVGISQQQQEEIFCAQLNLARQYQLPVIVHHRKSHHRILHCLKTTGFDQGGVIHAFSGSIEQAQAYLNWGFKLGIGGTITYPRARKTRDAVAALPIEAILLETDAPDMPINGRQGQRNSPEYLDEVLLALAEIREEPLDELEQRTDENARRLFGLS
ncbi:TatD family hydrolase [Lacimicrobium alkaliphilum]|uniref:Deoxyribonuclease n=1 Tax=Lacimicrobium alkaliphilum TaxID=1526571 RepID=A0ABQ1RE59_9ALTE|nr:TatD family hydrolase [Lacimicrobium alkaliphilum]GGD67500.1 deoxyribonuclease [Lacimicrobium alkaliphilum]